MGALHVPEHVSKFRKAKVLLLLSLLASCGCVTNERFSRQVSGDNNKDLCKHISFQDIYANYTVERDEPFELRALKGVVRSRTGIEFPEGSVSIQLRPVLQASLTYQTYSGKAGAFEIEDLPEGLYCYVIFVAGWQAEEGRLAINRNKSEGAIMDVTLILDQ